MNEEAIKELLSVTYVKFLADYGGYATSKANVDFGEDLALQEINLVEQVGRFSFLTMGKIVGVQLKCTTLRRVRKIENKLRFRLKVRNFNHLVYRRKEEMGNNYAPLILIVLVLPDRKKEWLNLNVEKGEFMVRGKAYWYIPSFEENYSNRKSFQPIQIPIENQLTLNSIQSIFEKIFKPKS